MDLIAQAQFLHTVNPNGHCDCKDCLIDVMSATVKVSKRTDHSFFEDAIESHRNGKNVSCMSTLCSQLQLVCTVSAIKQNNETNFKFYLGEWNQRLLIAAESSSI